MTLCHILYVPVSAACVPSLYVCSLCGLVIGYVRWSTVIGQFESGEQSAVDQTAEFTADNDGPSSCLGSLSFSISNLIPAHSLHVGTQHLF